PRLSSACGGGDGGLRGGAVGQRIFDGLSAGAVRARHTWTGWWRASPKKPTRARLYRRLRRHWSVVHGVAASHWSCAPKLRTRRPYGPRARPAHSPADALVCSARTRLDRPYLPWHSRAPVV